VKHQAAYLPGVVFPGLRSAPTGSTGRQSQRPGTFLLSDFLVQNMPLRPVFVLGGAKANFLPAQLDEPTMKAHSVYAWPEGLSEALYNGTLHPSVDSLFKYHAAIVNRLSITPNRFKPSETEASWEWLALDAFWNCHYRMAWHMINYGIRDAGEHKYIVESDDETGDVKQEEVDTDSQSKRAFRLAMEIYQVRPPRCLLFWSMVRSRAQEPTAHETLSGTRVRTYDYGADAGEGGRAAGQAARAPALKLRPQLRRIHLQSACTALHCTALHCTALHCTALLCTALHPPGVSRSALRVCALRCAWRLACVAACVSANAPERPAYHCLQTDDHRSFTVFPSSSVTRSYSSG